MMITVGKETKSVDVQKYTSKEKPNTSFYLTDLPNSFVETGKRFLGQELKNVKLIDI